MAIRFPIGDGLSIPPVGSGGVGTTYSNLISTSQVAGLTAALDEANKRADALQDQLAAVHDEIAKFKRWRAYYSWLMFAGVCAPGFLSLILRLWGH